MPPLTFPYGDPVAGEFMLAIKLVTSRATALAG
jgi:hypothetical protein